MKLISRIVMDLVIFYFQLIASFAILGWLFKTATKIREKKEARMTPASI